MNRFSRYALPVALLAATLAATPTATVPPASALPGSPTVGIVNAIHRVPAGTTVRFHVLSPISSNETEIGTTFPLQLSDAIVVDDVPVAPAGSPGIGTLLYVSPAGMHGHEGDLVLRLDSVQGFNGQRVVFNNAHFDMHGGNNRGIVAVLSTIPGFVFAATLNANNLYNPNQTYTSAQAQATVDNGVNIVRNRLIISGIASAAIGYAASFIHGNNLVIGVSDNLETTLTRPASVVAACMPQTNTPAGSMAPASTEGPCLPLTIAPLPATGSLTP